MRRVVVTGVGVISPLGIGAAEHWTRLLRGESAVKPAAQAEYRHLPHLQAHVPDFDRKTYIPDRILRKLLSACAAYPVVAAGEALQDAGLKPGAPDLERCGLYVGSIGIDANLDTFLPAFKESLNDVGQFEMARFARRGMRLLDPLFLVKALPNGGLCGISIQYQVLGANANITNGTVSGLQAVAVATSAIRRGEIDLALAGGYDSLIRLDAIMEYTLAGSLAHDGRRGFAVGEGAAFVMLEAEEHARARSAHVYGEVLGTGQTTNGSLLNNHHAAEDRATPLEQAARQALRQAACPPSCIGAVFGDGLGTESDDARERNALEHLVARGPAPPFAAASSAVGFCGAASGPLSLVSALLSLRDRVAAPHALVWNSDRGLKNVAVLIGPADG